MSDNKTIISDFESFVEKVSDPSYEVTVGDRRNYFDKLGTIQDILNDDSTTLKVYKELNKLVRQVQAIFN